MKESVATVGFTDAELAKKCLSIVAQLAGPGLDRGSMRCLDPVRIRSASFVGSPWCRRAQSHKLRLANEDLGRVHPDPVCRSLACSGGPSREPPAPPRGFPAPR